MANPKDLLIRGEFYLQEFQNEVYSVGSCARTRLRWLERRRCLRFRQTSYVHPRAGLASFHRDSPCGCTFTQQDPTGQDAHYVYSGNSPVTNTDPGGAGFCPLRRNPNGSCRGGRQANGLAYALDTPGRLLSENREAIKDLAKDILSQGAKTVTGCAKGVFSTQRLIHN